MTSDISVVCPEDKLTGSDAAADSAKGILVRKWASKNNVNTITYVKENVDSVVQAARAHDVGVVVDFGYLLPRSILDAFAVPPILMHPSLLPKYRGAAPMEHAIMAGDEISGVSVLTVHPSKFDAGQILLQRQVPMGRDDTIKELRPTLARIGAESVLAVLRSPELLKGVAPVTDKAVVPITAPKLKSSDYWPNWATASALAVYNRWRALQVLRARLEATPELGNLLDKGAPIGTVVMIHKFESPHSTSLPAFLSSPADQLQASEQLLKQVLDNQASGCCFFDKDTNLLWVKCSSATWLPISRLQLPSRSVVDASSFLNGLKIRKPHLVAQLRLVCEPDR